MPQLVGLPGVKAKAIDSPSVSTRTAAIREIKRGARAITAAGDDGAINVWKDDDGMWRCEFQRYKSTLDSKTYRYLAAVDQWLKEWMPKLYEFHS